MTDSIGAARPARFADTFAAEWTKLWTLRGIRGSLLGAVVLGVAVAALFCLTLGSTTGVPLFERTPFDVVTTSLLGVDAASLVLLVTAAATTGSEYANGMIRTTLTATPNRVRFLAAKTAAVGVVSLVAGLAVALLACATGQVVLLAAELPTVDFTAPAVVRLIVGTAITAPFYCIVATSFAIVTRTTTGGVVAALVMVVVPTVVGWLPDWWRANVLPYLPAEALHSLSGLTPADKVHYLSGGVAVTVLVAWTLFALALAWRALTRDV